LAICSTAWAKPEFVTVPAAEDSCRTSEAPSGFGKIGLLIL
jgi:hypothetical protein